MPCRERWAMRHMSQRHSGDLRHCEFENRRRISCVVGGKALKSMTFQGWP
jgi:hypothetical protein